MVEVQNQKGAVSATYSCLLVFIIVTTTAAFLRLGKFTQASVLIPALWGLGAVLPLRAGEGRLLTFGLKTPGLQKNILYFLLSSLIVFPLYSAGFWLYIRWGFFLPVTTPFEGVSIPQWLLYNFLAVALFEELFFRGFIQGRFESFARARFQKALAIFWVPVVLSAFLFALAHVAVYWDPLRLAVFFPGIFFGWLRAKTGSLLASILSHGTSNLVSMLLIGSVS